MDKKLYSDTAILILLLTIVSIAGIHFYEIGFCRHFGIPTEFISFELNKYSFLLFTFLAALFFSALVVDGVVGHIVSFSKIKNKFLRIILILLILAATIFVLKDYLVFLKLQEILTLLLVTLFGVMLLLNTNNPDSFYDIVSPKYSINVFLARKTGNILGPVLIVSAIICILLFCLGYFTAQSQKIFSVKPDNKTILLKKYGPNTVYGTLDNGKVTQIVIEQNQSKVDTFHFVNIK